MQQTNIHPQVLLSISSQILTNKVNFPNKTIHAGILLGFYNSKINKTDILDSFEISYSGQDELTHLEIEFFKERQQLRLKGDKWNLFKKFGYCRFNQQQIQQDGILQIIIKIIIQNYIHNYKIQSKQIYEKIKHLSLNIYYALIHLNNKMQISQSKIEPQSEEMIGITSLFSQQKSQSNKNFDLRVNSQLQIITFLEVLQQLDDPQIINDPLALQKINEVLISFPQIHQQNIEQDYFKLLIISYYCAILKLDVQRNKQQN
ncbi:unnamed protein product [Paramecium primaurelia]|uniref:Uncharacterized protein n=1 Tax=Paramecium primaurelia TaxID=5886 RepID=A0A8S1L0N6_PARPR|nr:unnamed protein product [Paramecium primaurelia]